ncbi:hypothetical protein [Myceligenerans crystallogenes]|uniref:Uncharacterized protein n=1 Tax=Myceligenerans crystallogenes TaxID=316335 RepID=A0ABP4ZJ19_9MICO
MPGWFWVTLWSVLVAAALVGALLLGSWLWRLVKELMAELERAEEAHAPGLIRLDQALNPASSSDSGGEDDDDAHLPSMFADDLTTHYARLGALREAGRDRAAARRERHRVTWERWRRFNDPVNGRGFGDDRV